MDCVLCSPSPTSRSTARRSRSVSRPAAACWRQPARSTVWSPWAGKIQRGVKIDSKQDRGRGDRLACCLIPWATGSDRRRPVAKQHVLRFLTSNRTAEQACLSVLVARPHKCAPGLKVNGNWHPDTAPMPRPAVVENRSSRFPLQLCDLCHSRATSRCRRTVFSHARTRH